MKRIVCENLDTLLCEAADRYRLLSCPPSTTTVLRHVRWSRSGRYVLTRSRGEPTWPLPISPMSSRGAGPSQAPARRTAARPVGARSRLADVADRTVTIARGVDVRHEHRESIAGHIRKRIADIADAVAIGLLRIRVDRAVAARIAIAVAILVVARTRRLRVARGAVAARDVVVEVEPAASGQDDDKDGRAHSTDSSALSGEKRIQLAERLGHAVVRALRRLERFGRRIQLVQDDPRRVAVVLERQRAELASVAALVVRPHQS